MFNGIMLLKPLDELTRQEYNSIEYTFLSSIGEILSDIENDIEAGFDVTAQQEYVDNLIFMVDGISEYYARYNTVD